MLDENISREQHEDKLKEIAWGFDSDDAKIILDVFVQKYPSLVFRSLHERFQEMLKTSTDIKKTLNIMYGMNGDFHYDPLANLPSEGGQV